MSASENQTSSASRRHRRLLVPAVAALILGAGLAVPYVWPHAGARAADPVAASAQAVPEVGS